MSEFEKLVNDYDEFEYNYDTYGYHDAFSDREESRAAIAEAFHDADFRESIIYRLTEIADEGDEWTALAEALIERIHKMFD